MPTECAAADCKSYKQKSSGLSFHRFPKDEALRRQWLVNMNRFDPTTKKLWKPNEYSVLCAKHFEEKCYTARSRLSKEMGQKYQVQLEKDAVPTIFDHKLCKRQLNVQVERTAFSKRRRNEVSLTDLTFAERPCYIVTEKGLDLAIK